MLNGVKLRTIQRMMHDKKSHSQAIGKTHQVLLEDSVRTGVRATAITKDNNSTRIGILFLHVLPPDPFNVITDKPVSVVAGSEGHITDVFVTS